MLPRWGKDQPFHQTVWPPLLFLLPQEADGWAVIQPSSEFAAVNTDYFLLLSVITAFWQFHCSHWIEKRSPQTSAFFKYLPLRGPIAGQFKDMMASGALPNDRLDLLVITAPA